MILQRNVWRVGFVKIVKFKLPYFLDFEADFSETSHFHRTHLGESIHDLGFSLLIIISV